MYADTLVRVVGNRYHPVSRYFFTVLTVE